MTDDGLFGFELDVNTEIKLDDDEDYYDNYLSIPTPKTTPAKRKDEIPTTMMMAKWIQHNESRRLLKVLLDSGGSNTMIHASCLP